MGPRRSGDALTCWPIAGEMQGQRGLADAALLIEERNDHLALLALLRSAVLG